jgi:DNA repair exonuclease SbcCD ATPase subunit
MTQEQPQNNTGVETQPAAGANEGMEKAFAARLAKERERLEGELRQKYESELKSHPTLSYLEQKAQRLGMTVEQLIENDRKYEEQLEIQQRAQKDQVSYEYAERLYKLEQKEQQREQEAESIRQKQEQQQMYAEFLEAYPEFQDPQKANEIPPEVWQAVQKGERLLNAYARYENQRLKAEMAKYQQQQQTQQANLNNAATSTGSVKDGGKGGEFISLDEFEANRHDQSWVMKNYSRIQKSRAKW